MGVHRPEAEVLRLLKKLGSFTGSETFLSAHRRFFVDNCQAFQEGENTLECTDIHVRYNQLVEGLLSESFAPEEMETLVDGVDILIHDTAVVKIQGKEVDLDGNLHCLTHLLFCKDFQVFKQEMLAAKEGMLGVRPADETDAPNNSDGFEENVAHKMADKEGWTMLKDTNELAYGWHVASGGRIWKCRTLIDLSCCQALDMIFRSLLDGRATKMMSFMSGIELLEHTQEGSTCESIKIRVKHSKDGVLNKMFSLIVGDTVEIGIKLRNNYPSKGDYMLHFKVGGASLKDQNLLLQTHPTESSKCLACIMDEWHPMIPTFFKKFMYGKFFPNMIASTVSTYKEIFLK